MFSFTSNHSKSFYSFPGKGVFVLPVLLCLLGALLFTGCDTGGDDFVDDQRLNSALTGTWASSSGDSYVITGDHVTYGPAYGYAGRIEYVSNFSGTSGVLIIKYDEGQEQKYYETYDPVTYLPVGDPLPSRGDYLGIYFKELKPGVSAKIGCAWVEGGAEEATLEAAKAAFTMGNEGRYMGSYGTYTK